MIGRMIDEHQRDWDRLLPYVMAAYRSSKHEATRYTPNLLMMGREVRAAVDVVYGFSEAKPPSSYDCYADELQHRMVTAYSKRYYDLKVKPQRYSIGNWVYFYNPRKYVGRQDKWLRKFTGPYLVVDVPGPVNVKLQLSRKAKPFYTHVDKVKPYVSDSFPKSWLTESAADSREPVTCMADGLQAVAKPEAAVDEAIAGAALAQDCSSPRPRRQARRPRRFMH